MSGFTPLRETAHPLFGDQLPKLLDELNTVLSA